ncbi:MAG TPA: hypothetical protein DCP92_08470 [Nitrospiraceae bacterium]|nr:hypothetical protein [Nitrospiraceae bacterium]
MLDSLKRKVVPLDLEDILASVMRRTRLEDLDDPQCKDSLKILIASCNLEASLSLVGRIAARQHLQDLLETRLRLIDYWRQTPEIQKQTVHPPLFITGSPKSGSTFLHRLCAEDPSNRVPRTWEVMFPLPPPARDTFDSDPRIMQTEDRLRWLNRMQPEVTKAHPVGARLLQECGPILGYTFRSHVFLDIFWIPSYETWLRSQDLGPSYKFHMNFLKHLPWLCPGERWVLKSSDHVHALATLFETYPEAGVIFLHRDPMKVLQSSSSQMTLLKDTFSRSIDPRRLGANEARILTDKLNKIIEFRNSHAHMEDRFIDVRYLNLANDPIGTMRVIYDRFGLTLSPLAEVRMEACIKDECVKRSADKYFLGDFGLDPQHEDPQFAAYRERFRVEREPL